MSCKYDPIPHNGTPVKPYHLMENNESSHKVSGRMEFPNFLSRVLLD
jgi:hypothetical protein